MEVLTAVDRDQIEALRARDEFFWLDLKDPSDADLDAAGELLGLHELALEDTREFSQRPKLDRYPERVLLVYWSARVTADGLGTELVEVHLHISGGFLLTVRREPCIELDELHDALAPEGVEAEDYILYRVLDAPDRRAVPGHRAPRGPDRRARGGGAAQHRPAPAGRDLPAQAGGAAARSPAGRRSATSSARRPMRSSRCPASRMARASTCATSATT